MIEPVAWMAKNGEVCRHGWRKFHAREDDIDKFNVPLYIHPDPRVAELEAVLRECRGVLSFINRLDDDRDFLDQPEYEQIHKAIAKIDEVLNEDR